MSLTATHLLDIPTKDFANLLQNENDILSMNEKITFWGARIIVINNKNYALDDVAKKTLAATNFLLASEKPLTPDRTAAIRVLATLYKLKQTYISLSGVIQISPFFTRLLIWIRNFFPSQKILKSISKKLA